ncbi:50S ribosomal protein L17 [Bifidobacterium psychraerophilum]|uniref:50S ribosomal protein L17 n=1 Tax=Bifidobacterium psychraerophilum TaxID=218140 RepID=UPI0033429016
MPRPKKGPRLASSPAHERLMLANMATSLFQHGQITTTLPKAKRLRPLAERLITFAKRGDLHSRRRVMRVIRNKTVVHILFTQIAEQMEQREGGYTRITRIPARHGDNAPQAVIELVTEPLSAKQSTVKEAEAAAKVAAQDNATEMDTAVDAAIVEGAGADAVDQAVEANESGVDVESANETAIDLEKDAEAADAKEADAEENADVAEDAEKAE